MSYLWCMAHLQLARNSGHSSHASVLPCPAAFSQKLAAVLQKRKSLAGKDWKGVHHNWGGLLLGLGTLIAVVGPANTYIRLGKLFPGAQVLQTGHRSEAQQLQTRKLGQIVQSAKLQQRTHAKQRGTLLPRRC